MQTESCRKLSTLCDCRTRQELGWKLRDLMPVHLCNTKREKAISSLVATRWKYQKTSLHHQPKGHRSSNRCRIVVSALIEAVSCYLLKISLISELTSKPYHGRYMKAKYDMLYHALLIPAVDLSKICLSRPCSVIRLSHWASNALMYSTAAANTAASSRFSIFADTIVWIWSGAETRYRSWLSVSSKEAGDVSVCIDIMNNVVVRCWRYR